MPDAPRTADKPRTAYARATDPIHVCEQLPPQPDPTDCRHRCWPLTWRIRTSAAVAVATRKPSSSMTPPQSIRKVQCAASSSLALISDSPPLPST
ncbi:hypothetical protein BXOR1_20370 [Xanthomonas oryzae pv. oryzicola]|nr:hypothetical protein BXOR1_20370 [Xanthomonas oryzae pv. oryzicola]